MTGEDQETRSMLKVLAEMVIGSLLGPVLFIAFLLLIAWFARRVLGL